MPPDPSGRRDDPLPRSGISLQTLLIASLASAAASYAVAHIWGPGTILGAAAAPVIIALVSETLRRPMLTVSANARKTPSLSRTRLLTPRQWQIRWRVAGATGLAAFAIVVVVFTVPDLLAGSSITGNGQPTTFFSGASHGGKPTGPSAVPTTTTSRTTVTRTTTETPTTHTSSTTTATSVGTTGTARPVRTAGPASTAGTTPTTTSTSTTISTSTSTSITSSVPTVAGSTTPAIPAP